MRARGIEPPRADAHRVLRAQPRLPAELGDATDPGDALALDRALVEASPQHDERLHPDSGQADAAEKGDGKRAGLGQGAVVDPARPCMVAGL